MHKNTKKNCKSFRLDKSNAVGMGTTAIKQYFSICPVGLDIVGKFNLQRPSFSYGGLRTVPFEPRCWGLKQNTQLLSGWWYRNTLSCLALWTLEICNGPLSLSPNIFHPWQKCRTPGKSRYTDNSNWSHCTPENRPIFRSKL